MASVGVCWSDQNLQFFFAKCLGISYWPGHCNWFLIKTRFITFFRCFCFQTQQRFYMCSERNYHQLFIWCNHSHDIMRVAERNVGKTSQDFSRNMFFINRTLFQYFFSEPNQNSFLNKLETMQNFETFLKPYTFFQIQKLFLHSGNMHSLKPRMCFKIMSSSMASRIIAFCWNTPFWRMSLQTFKK